jgi:hypothetical protein
MESFHFIDTSNQLALSEGGYENISIMREMAVPDLDFLYNIEHKINSEQYADCILIRSACGVTR